MLKRSILLMGLLLAGACFGEDAPVRVTTFELRDGKIFQALSYSSSGANDLKSYVILTPKGERLTLLDKEIVSRKAQSLPLDKFPEAARKEILKNRAAANSVRAESEVAVQADRAASGERQKEFDVLAALNKARTEYSLANSTVQNAENTQRNAPIDIARADARYDAAKTEINSGSTAGNFGVYRVGSNSFSRADYLRNLMMQAAEEKARIESEKKDADEQIKRIEPTLKALGGRVEVLMQEYAAAQAETRNSYLKAGGGARNEEFSIRKAP